MTHTPSDHFEVRTYGGKGASLLHLRALGYTVPPFVIIPADRLDALKDAGGAISEAAITSSGLLQSVLQAWDANPDGNETLAVRSSAVVEDGAAYSFAGQFSTELNVAQQALPAAVARVWMSGNSASVKAYKKEGDFDEDNSMAVIIQKMIQADAAGVAFGIHPLRGDRSNVVINAVRGLGDSLVSGAANADSYEVDMEGRIIAKVLNEEAVLSDGQVREVANLIRSLEKALGAPQDIEFAFEGGRFYLLQSRPITAQLGAAAPNPIVWDNSNIVESYPDLTLPLTYSFIEKMYAAVYRQFTLVLGVRPKKVAKHDAVFNSMLGLLNGRVYYNLNSWYAALALLPGYSINATFMEGMMGVKEAPPIPMPAPPRAGLSDYLDIASAVSAILGKLRGARKSKDAFVRGFDEVYDRFRHKDFALQGGQQTLRDYDKFEGLMLAHWEAPLVNDFFAMIYFGLLRKMCEKHLPGLPGLHNELISDSKDIITTQPLKLLPGLAEMLSGNDALRACAQNSSPEALWQMLQQPQFAEELARINAYLEAWGERCIAELKLETITYLQDPSKLMAILQSYLRDNISAYRSAGSGLRADAAAAMEDALRGKWLAKSIFRHVLNQARYFVSNRENLRYYRTKGFGLVRRMMLGIGKGLLEGGFIADARDVFYLKLDEVKSLAEHPTDMQQTIALRKEQYCRYAIMPLPDRIITDGPPPEFIVPPPPKEGTSAEDGNLLQGTPCSAGVVRARIRLVRTAEVLSSLDGCIMATYATDPGYVVLFPTASGILTERGSLLSHAAIVSREMGIPCIVGIAGLMDRLKDGDEVIMDGKEGTLQIISIHEQH